MMSEFSKNETTPAQMVLVLLHGRWYEPDSMHQLVRRIDLPDLRCVAPTTPGREWYPNRFMDPRETNEPAISQAVEQVHSTIDQLEAGGISHRRIVLGGFSQGAVVALEAVVRRPRPIAALVALCAGLMGSSDSEIVQPSPGTLAGLPVLLTGTQQDAWIPVERVERTARILAAAGARVDMRVYPPGEHRVHAQEVVALRDLLLQLGDTTEH